MSRKPLDKDDIIVVGRVDGIGVAWSQNSQTFSAPDSPDLLKKVNFCASVGKQAQPHPFGPWVEAGNTTPLEAAAAIMACSGRAEILQAPEEWWALIPELPEKLAGETIIEENENELWGSWEETNV